MLNLHRGSKSRSATSGVDFSALKGVYFLFETRLTVIWAHPANSAFSLYDCSTTITISSKASLAVMAYAYMNRSSSQQVLSQHYKNINYCYKL